MEAFLSVSASSQYQEQLREYTSSLLEQRCTKPEWCVLALEEGVPVARAALWSLPEQEVPSDLVLIDADWSDDELSAGRGLLARVHELAGVLGADVLSHSVDSPPGAPQYQENEDARDRLLTESGYHLVRDGFRWQYFAPSSLDQSKDHDSLDYRPLTEVGDDAFVDAIASTYQGTRDSWLSQNIEEHGLQGAARTDFYDLQGMDYEPEWWELAYEGDVLAGVIMAARNPSTAVIAYVGVVPERRGRGLAPQLLRRGTNQLLESGAHEIRGDCDLDNVAMVKAFERAGYEQFARRRTYQHSVANRESGT